MITDGYIQKLDPSFHFSRHTFQFCQVLHHQVSKRGPKRTSSAMFARLALEHNMVNLRWTGRIAKIFAHSRAASFPCTVLIGPRAFLFVCRQFCWNHRGFWIVLCKQIPLYVLNSQRFCRPARRTCPLLLRGTLSWLTEMICAKNHFGCVVVTTENVEDNVPFFPLLFECPRSNALDPREIRSVSLSPKLSIMAPQIYHSVCTYEIPSHLFSDPSPRNDPRPCANPPCIFFKGFWNSPVHNSWFPFFSVQMSLYIDNEDDSSLGIAQVHTISSCFWISARICKRCESWGKVSTRTPSALRRVRSNSLYWSELWNQSIFSFQAWTGFALIPSHTQ